MATAAEALTSTDPDTVKRFRRSCRIQIFCTKNILEKTLSQRNNEEFEFEKISPLLIENHKVKLRNQFDLIQNLHERYIELCYGCPVMNDEKESIKEDIAFLEDISSKVYPVLDVISQYEESFKRWIRFKDLIKNKDETRSKVLQCK